LLKVIEDHYNKCIADGRTPQQARYFLPNGLKTEIRITYNLREWKHFFSLRTVEGAHPQMIALATDILEHFKKDFPVFFMDML
jgi:thymidylate synthase (FAD)